MRFYSGAEIALSYIAVIGSRFWVFCQKFNCIYNQVEVAIRLLQRPIFKGIKPYCLKVLICGFTYFVMHYSVGGFREDFLGLACD